MATPKQGQYIASLISKGVEYPTLVRIWEEQAKFKTEKIDNRTVELGKKIETKISNYNAGIIINWFLGKKDKFGKDISTKLVFTILTNANLLD